MGPVGGERRGKEEEWERRGVEGGRKGRGGEEGAAQWRKNWGVEFDRAEDLGDVFGYFALSGASSVEIGNSQLPADLFFFTALSR